jgi:hypothetical protein
MNLRRNQRAHLPAGEAGPAPKPRQNKEDTLRMIDRQFNSPDPFEGDIYVAGSTWLQRDAKIGYKGLT